MDQTLVDLVTQHKWIALAALLIGLVVRLLKEDGPIPINIPPKYRPWLAMGLGIAAGILDKVASGTPWTPALVGGVMAALVAMSSHDLVVQSARGGREIGESKPDFVKRSFHPPPMPPS